MGLEQNDPKVNKKQYALPIAKQKALANKTRLKKTQMEGAKGIHL